MKKTRKWLRLTMEQQSAICRRNFTGKIPDGGWFGVGETRRYATWDDLEFVCHMMVSVYHDKLPKHARIENAQIDYPYGDKGGVRRLRGR